MMKENARARSWSGCGGRFHRGSSACQAAHDIQLAQAHNTGAHQELDRRHSAKQLRKPFIERGVVCRSRPILQCTNTWKAIEYESGSEGKGI
jgi:hypothetical protein